MILIIGSATIVWAISRVDIDNDASFGYTSSHFEVDSGDCETGCDTWEGTPGYMYGGSGDFDSGTGSGYYGWTGYWYTDENELDGGKYAKLGVLVDYEELQDTAGEAIFKMWLFVYEKQEGHWVNVESDYWDSESSSTPESTKWLQCNYDFGTAEYKFRFLGRAHLDAPDSNTVIYNLEVDDNQPTRGLFVDD